MKAKRHISFILCILMLISLVPAQVFADDEAEGSFADDEIIVLSADDYADDETAAEEPTSQDTPTQDEQPDAEEAPDAEQPADEEPAGEEQLPEMADDETDEIPADETTDEEIPDEPETDKSEDEELEVHQLNYAYVYVNPNYSYLFGESHEVEYVAAEAEDLDNLFDETYVDADTASSQIASYMAARTATFTVYVKMPLSEGGNVSTFMWNLGANAGKHTGNPILGDSIEYQYATIHYSLGTYTNDSNYYYLKVTLTPEYYTTAAEESTLSSKVSSIVSSLGLRSTAYTDYQKICRIYDYLCSTITYDNAHLNDNVYYLKFTAYAALCQNTAVCQGIAVAFYRLCLEAGIQTRVVVSESMRHAWNIVYPGNGKYYYLDATWDLGKSADNYSYFLKGTNSFSTKHGKGDLGQVGPAIYNADIEAYTRASATAVYNIDSEDYFTGPAVDIKFDAPVLTSAANYASYIKVTWKAVSGAELYRLSYREGTGEWVKICDTTGTAINVKDVKDGVTYTFKVECYTKDGRTRTSPDGRIGQMRLTTPAIRVNRFGTPGVDGGFRVSWDATEGGSCYKIYYREKGGSWVLYTMIPKSSNTLFCNIKEKVTNASSKMTDLVPGTTYEFMVLTCTSVSYVTSGFPTPFTELAYN